MLTFIPRICDPVASKLFYAGIECGDRNFSIINKKLQFYAKQVQEGLIALPTIDLKSNMHWEERLKAAQQPIVQEVLRQLSVLQINDAFEAKTLADCKDWFSSRYSGRPDAELEQMYYEVQSLLPAEQQPSKLPLLQGQKRKPELPPCAFTSPTKGKHDFGFDGEPFLAEELESLLQGHCKTPPPKQAISEPESTEKLEPPTGQDTGVPSPSQEPKEDTSNEATDPKEITDAEGPGWPLAAEDFREMHVKLEDVPSFGPCAITTVIKDGSQNSDPEGSCLSLQEHVAAKKRRGQDALVHDFIKGQVLAIVKFPTAIMSAKAFKSLSESERSGFLYHVALKSATRIVQVPNSLEIDHQTAASAEVGTAGKLLTPDGKAFRSTDVYTFGADCISSKNFLLMVTQYSLFDGREVVPVVSQEAQHGSITLLGLAVCASKKITLYRDKFMPLYELSNDDDEKNEDVEE